MSFGIGESVGHYEIVEELGSGASGRVLKVQHLITRRREAMKVLVDNKPDSPEQAQRFLREIRLQASLDHPNIAAVHNAFWLEDDLVMIMELIEGQTLATLLEHRRFSLDQGLTIIRQVLQALAYAHRNGVIHRDVSPANIVVNAQGKVKLTDFGLAKGLSDPSLTEMGGMYGSPFYVSPEQVRGAANVDHRSDIYSTAVVLYELVTGTRPFIAASSFLLMQAHVQQVPEPPIYRNSAIPQYLNRAILRALAKNPDDRFQSSEEFLAAVDGPQAAPAPAAPAARSALASSALASSALASSAPPVAPTPNAEPPLSASPAEASPAKPAEYSYSFAQPQSYEPIEFEPVVNKPWSTPAAAPAKAPASSGGPAWLRNPVVGGLVGLGLVLSIVLPLIYWNSRSTESGPSRPSLSVSPTPSEPLAVEPAGPNKGTALRSNDAPLVAGPKEIPIPATKAPSSYRATGTRAAKPLPPRPQPVMKIWGADPAPAPAPPPVAANSAPPVPSPAPPKTPALKLEEPPILGASTSPTSGAAVPAVATPTMEPLPQGPAKRGFFRRLAKGVKALNPVRKETPNPAPGAAIPPTPSAAPPR